MSAAIKPNEPSSATQKFFRKLHLNAKNTTTRAELVQQQQQLKPKKNVKDTKVQERHKKAKKLSTLLSNRRQDQDTPKKKEPCTTEHGITSPPISPTPNHKQGQPRRTSEVNSPQSPKRTGSPAVMSDTVQNQILQEQLEKLATEQRAETCLPSPPVTPAALMTPESETEPKAADVVRPRRLRPAASFAALRPGNHSPHLAHYISRAQPMSYIDAGGDYMIVKKSCFEEPLKRVHRQRIHKRLSEHDLSPSNHHHLPDFIDERFFYQMHHDTSSDSSQSEYKTIRRVDSAKSIASASEHKYESLRNALEKEKAVVRALQKQKEACNRDIAFLSRTNEELLTENQELKKKLEYEKIMKERFQDDLSSTMDKLSEATEHIRKLETQNKQLKSEKEEKEKEHKRHSKPPFDTGRSGDRLLSAQLRHSQNQVRILKSTMEQFLRMGVFNDELPSNVASPTTSIESIVFEQKPKRKARTLHVQNKMAIKSSNENEIKLKKSVESQPSEKVKSIETEKSDTSSNSVEKKESVQNGENLLKQPLKKAEEPKKQEEQKETKDTISDLDKQLRDLVREKEILQGEYSKAPSSGGNALIRRRREELESKLDSIDSQMCRIKLKIRSRQIY